MKLNKSSREWTHCNSVCADAPYLHITDNVKHVESFDVVFTPPDVLLEMPVVCKTFGLELRRCLFEPQIWLVLSDCFLMFY